MRFFGSMEYISFDCQRRTGSYLRHKPAHLATGTQPQTPSDLPFSTEESNSSPLFNSNKQLFDGMKWQLCSWGGKWNVRIKYIIISC